MQMWKFFALIMLITGLLVLPIGGAYAAEEGDTASEEHSGSAKGAGQVILIVGLGMVGAVGFAYWTRQQGGNAEGQQ